MPRRFFETANYVLDSLRGIGLQPHPDSRIQRMWRAVCNPDGGARQVQSTDPDLNVALEAFRDFQQLAFVFDALGLPTSSTERQRFRRLLKDSVLPEQDRKDSVGRDSQCELYVTAICHKAGLPFRHEEPDLCISLAGQEFGVAVKRLKSAAGIEEIIRRAASQIRDAGLPGIVVVDTSLAFNPANQRILAPLSDDDFTELHRAAFHDFIDRRYSAIREWVRSKNVRGIIFHDHHIHHNPLHGWTLQSLTFSVCTVGPDPGLEREFGAFDAAYKRGLPT